MRILTVYILGLLKTVVVVLKCLTTPLPSAFRNVSTFTSRHVEKCSVVVEKFKNAKFKHLSTKNLFNFTLNVYMLQIIYFMFIIKQLCKTQFLLFLPYLE